MFSKNSNDVVPVKSNFTHSVGSTVRFFCASSGNPLPTVSWSVQNKTAPEYAHWTEEITETGKFLIAEAEGRVSRWQCAEVECAQLKVACRADNLRYTNIRTFVIKTIESERDKPFLKLEVGCYSAIYLGTIRRRIFKKFEVSIRVQPEADNMTFS